MADELPLITGDLAAGQVAGYRPAEQIGWGGMAVVYRALDVRLDRWVALKILAPEIARDESFRQRFISESRAAAAVDHPHIIPVFEAGESGGVLFIAMRYVGGGDVGTLVRRHGPLDAVRAAGIVAQVASALDAAHAAGLVHRDVKPANMLLTPAGADGVSPDHVYLADFGLSRQALSPAGPMLAGQFVGTLDYMAPELIKHRPVDGRADLYALACAAYEMLAGQPPFRRAGEAGLMWAQLAETPPLLTSLRHDLPTAVDQVMTRAMAKSPAGRYQSCLEFAASLVQACGLKWSVTGQLLPGQPGADRQPTAAWTAAGPAVARDHAGAPAATQRDTAKPGSSLALQSTPAGPAGATCTTDRGWRAAAELQVTGLRLIERAPDGLGPDGLGPDGLGPDMLGLGKPGPARRGPAGPEPPRGRALTIAAATVVVILAITGAVLLALRGGAAPGSGHAGHGLRPAAISPDHRGSPGRHGQLRNPASPHRPVRPAGPGGPSRPARPTGPAATVRSYIAAINRHDYRRAWHLGGRNSSPSYPSFAGGFGTTARDSLVIQSVSGNVVTARLIAVQTDGSVKTYQGTYAVEDGVIATSVVARIG